VAASLAAPAASDRDLEAHKSTYAPYLPLISSGRSCSHLSRMVSKRLTDGSISHSFWSRPM
jgi:hypothetical protein